MAVDWGNVPEWIAACGTAAAFGAAASVLMRDRDERRRERAALIECELRTRGDSAEVVVINRSDKAVRNVRVLVQDPVQSVRRSVITHESPVTPRIRPKRELTVDVPLMPLDDLLPTYAVRFLDSAGQTWLTHVETGEVFQLLNPWHPKSIWRRLRGKYVPGLVPSGPH